MFTFEGDRELNATWFSWFQFCKCFLFLSPENKYYIYDSHFVAVKLFFMMMGILIIGHLFNTLNL